MKAPKETDLTRLSDLLAKTGVKARSWPLREWKDSAGNIVQEPGFVLVHGAEDDGPYAQYVFDTEGNLVKGGATACYSRGLDIFEQV